MCNFFFISHSCTKNLESMLTQVVLVVMISNMANDNPWLGCLLFWSHLKVNYYYDYYLLKKGVLHCCNLILWWLIIMWIFFIQRDLTKKVDLTLFLMNLWSFLFQKYVQQVTFKPKKISDVTLSDRQFVSSVNELLLSSFLVHWV